MIIAGLFGTLLAGVPLAFGLAGLLLPPGDGGRGRRRVAAAIGIAGAAISLGVTVFLLLVATVLPEHSANDPIEFTHRWITFGGIDVTFGFSAGAAALYVALAVTIVALAVQVYSVAYLHDDARYAPYAAQISLFTGAMLLVVTANDLILLLVGWEVMGACSYLLIGHDRRLPEAPRAAVKAFLVTRVGDVGFLLGIAILGVSAGSFQIAEVLAHDYHPGTLTAALILLLAGVAGKSAQFPLHTWLPDAMAGPTPVSALIHAATMVVAGVFLVARLYPVFYEGFSIANGGVNFMAAIGGITILVGAVLAFVQNDIKKVLAYSTISQLGYMVMALGCGAWTAAVFHLFTHAFFKALLFLGAGSVSHSGSHHSFDMKKDMGGLRKFMPVTFWTFMIGTVALAGIFPFAGFWSKDEILVNAGDHGYEIFMVVGLIGAFLTAAYMTRCVYLTFFGEYRGHGHPHESEKLITVPLIVLSVFSILAGFLNAAPFHIEKFQEWVEPTVQFPALTHSEFDYGAAVFSVAIATLGIGIAAFFWFRREEMNGLKGLTQRNKLANGVYTLLVNKFYLDALYEGVIVAGIKGPIARGVYWFNQNVIDGVLNGTARGAVSAGSFVYNTIDQKVVDGAVNEIAEVTGETGGLLRYLQSGRVQRYALFLFAAVGLFSLALLIANI
ncbi:MAG: NADH-quinone oxidoreductase subunit L [Acidimicrobiia bacterium]